MASHVDVEHVSLRVSVVDTAQGPTEPELLPYRSPPLNKYEQNICNNQVPHLEAIMG